MKIFSCRAMPLQMSAGGAFLIFTVGTLSGIGQLYVPCPERIFLLGVQVARNVMALLNLEQGRFFVGASFVSVRAASMEPAS